MPIPTMPAMLDDRARTLLKALVERYIADGQPVGSRALSKLAGLDLSPASIRNVMADLEEMGFVSSPHTSAGRIPTPKGYRFFVDTLLTVRPLEEVERAQIEDTLMPDDPHRVVAAASQVLSSITHLAGVVTIPRQPHQSLSQIEFLPLSDNRVLAVMVINGRDVQNRVVHLERYYSALVAQGIGLWLGTQALINMGVNMGVLPTKGLTLPLLSFGGSGIVANVTGLAILLRVDWENRELMRGRSV